MDKQNFDQFLLSLNSEELSFLLYDWYLWARSEQLPPDPKKNWKTWIFIGGRGAGKTRSGAEWVRALALGKQPFTEKPISEIALIGATFNDAHKVMVEGPSGILNIHPNHEKPVWLPSKNTLIWPNGSRGTIVSANIPDSLRGLQFGAAWCDEFSKWIYPKLSFDMLQFTLRLGDNPRQLITATPKPLSILKKIIQSKTSIVTHSTTMDNKSNLADGFYEYLKEKYQGTSMGMQELEGQFISHNNDKLWNPELIKYQEYCKEKLKHIVVAVDPPVTNGINSNACGLIVAGISNNGKYFILADKTIQRASPLQWTKEAHSAYHKYDANCIVAEINQGGDLVRNVLQQYDPSVMVKTVRAYRGKYLRAEPVAALYEQGAVLHVRSFSELEDEMFNFGSDGLSVGKSPDRVDALVWAITYLSQLKKNKPIIRTL